MNRPIGGYIELECGHNPLYHKGIYLNSGRNALRYIIRRLGIHKLFVPYYTCPVVNRAIEVEGCQVEQYTLDKTFMPERDLKKTDFIVYNNYFGVCGGKVRELAEQYPNLIVDNSQAFFSHQIGRAAFYSPRKFFGLPDGGIALFADKELNSRTEEFEFDQSMDRMSHLLKRIEFGAQVGYVDFQQANKQLVDQPIRKMSLLTSSLMGNIEYAYVASKRDNNFKILDNRLKSRFPFSCSQDDVPMVYPYVTDDGQLRKKLISNEVFVATYWPGIRLGLELASQIIPLPVDQRYELYDMNRILGLING